MTTGELYSWVYRSAANPQREQSLDAFLADLIFLPVEKESCRIFGQTRAALLDRGIGVPAMDLLIASTALAHYLTMATHNVRHFSFVPNLRIEDWLAK